MNRDLHPELGERVRRPDIDACLVDVRHLYPRVSMEGSTGAERSFWVGGSLVAHAWPVRGRCEDFWLRLRQPLNPQGTPTMASRMTIKAERLWEKEKGSGSV